MLDATTESDSVETIAFTTRFRRSDARDAARRMRESAQSGDRRFLLDLTNATSVAEGPLVLMLLGLRSELQRTSSQLVVAAEPELARRLGTHLRFEDVISAASSLPDATDRILGAGTTRTATAVRCDVMRLDRRYPAECDSVGQARWAVTGWLRDSLVDQDQLIGDVALAVTEACNNVVVHAYRSSDGDAEMETFRLVAERQGLTVFVTVSDDGGGAVPRPESPGMGLGLPLMAALCDELDIAPSARGTGTVVSMRFEGSEPAAL